MVTHESTDTYTGNAPQASFCPRSTANPSALLFLLLLVLVIDTEFFFQCRYPPIPAVENSMDLTKRSLFSVQTTVDDKKNACMHLHGWHPWLLVCETCIAQLAAREQGSCAHQRIRALTMASPKAPSSSSSTSPSSFGLIMPATARLVQLL